MKLSLKHTLAWLICLTLTALAPAQDATPAGNEPDPLFGHSMHGETFNEGPRQDAYLMQGTGAVRFPVTAASDEARGFILQGVGQLHGFWYFEAERSFRKAASIDPQCAIAYWGMAMANVNNEKRARGFINEAARRKDKASAHERLYIEALHAYYHSEKDKKTRGHDYARALERLLYQYPDDIEAKAFLALQLWQNSRSGEPLRSHLAVDALLSEVFAAEPMHPAHHYRIHLWDRERADKALESAAKCGPASPAIAHMWHMPGHIYSKLRRYGDAAWQQEASARVDHAHMMRDRIMPDQIHNFAHNNEWLIRNLNFLGRANDAVALARNMIELPRHPSYNTLKKGSANFGRQRLFETLDRYEMDAQLVALADTPYLEPTDVRAEQARRLLYLGRAAFRQAGADDLASHRAALAAMLSEPAKSEAPQKDEAEKEEASDDAKENEEKKDPPANAEAKTIQRYVDELTAYESALRGEFDAALSGLKKVKPLEPMHLARVQSMAGEHGEAEKTLRAHIRANANEVQPLAQLVGVLWAADKKEDARKAFDDLRKVAAHADLDVPPLARLAPIAEALGHPRDWRAEPAVATDLGERPPLDSLGPFRWQPSAAPAWRLKDAERKTHALADYKGRPVIVIFYLGGGCLHCTQQLQAFAPMTQKFKEAGIDLIAISTDTLPKLRESEKTYGEDFPITLVADAKMNIFRRYRAFDSFENQPLHGTFLIDGRGHVRWQDISYEPFMNAQFLLDESQRLLAQDKVELVVKNREAASGE